MTDPTQYMDTLARARADLDHLEQEDRGRNVPGQIMDEWLPDLEHIVMWGSKAEQLEAARLILGLLAVWCHHYAELHEPMVRAIPTYDRFDLFRALYDEFLDTDEYVRNVLVNLREGLRCGPVGLVAPI